MSLTARVITIIISLFLWNGIERALVGCCSILFLLVPLLNDIIINRKEYGYILIISLRLFFHLIWLSLCGIRGNNARIYTLSFYRKNDKWRPKPHIKSVQSFKEKLKGLSKRSQSISMSQRIAKLNPVIRGWINYFRICDMKGFMKELDGWLRTRIRMCIWKQWKTPQRREWALVKLGMKRWIAHRYANSSKGYMRIASSGIMTTTVTNAVLKKKGLLSLADHYELVHVK